MSPSQVREEAVGNLQAGERLSPGGLDTDTKRMSGVRPISPDDPTRQSGSCRTAPAHNTDIARANLDNLDGSTFAEIPCNEASGSIVIGRGNSATISVADPYVHRVHAYLTWDPGERVHVVSHAGGENTTYVNRRKVEEPIALSSGAHIRVGKSEFIYRRY